MKKHSLRLLAVLLSLAIVLLLAPCSFVITAESDDIGDYTGTDVDPDTGLSQCRHSYEWAIVKIATYSEPGDKEQVCSVCGHKSGIHESIEYVPQPGDVNGDGKVNNKDITRLFQYLSGWDVFVVDGAKDVNKDTVCNNKDLVKLFQYLSGWSVVID